MERNNVLSFKKTYKDDLYVLDFIDRAHCSARAIHVQSYTHFERLLSVASNCPELDFILITDEYINHWIPENVTLKKICDY